MNKIFNVIIGVIIATISSCSINTYDPALTTIDVTCYRLPDSMHLVNDSTSMALMLWQDYYSDYYLHNLIDSAISRNLSLHNAILQVNKAESYISRSNGSFLPNVNLSIYQNQMKVSRNPSAYNMHGVGLGISDWEIDMWSRLRNAKKSKIEALMKEQAVMQSVKVKLIADVATLYYRLVGLDAKLKAINEMITMNQHYLHELGSRYPQSLSNKEVSFSTVAVGRSALAIEQAKAELYRSKSLKPRIENDIFITENAINLLLSRSEGEIERIDIEQVVTSNSFNDTIDIGVPAHLISYRPDVIAAEYAVREAFAIKDAASAAMYPRITISGNLATEESLYGSWKNFPTSVVYNLFAGLTQPLFRKKELKHDLRIKEITTHQKVADFKQTLLKACIDVSNVLANYKTNREVIANMAKRYDALFNAYTFSRQLNLTNRADYIDVLVAQGQLLNARMELSDAMIAYYTNRVAIYRVLGGGAML